MTDLLDEDKTNSTLKTNLRANKIRVQNTTVHNLTNFHLQINKYTHLFIIFAPIEIFKTKIVC